MNIQNDFLKFRKENNELYLICLISSYYDNVIKEYFDDTIYITDTVDVIREKFQFIRSKKKETPNIREELTAREIDVLVQLLKGLSNKEIAEILNISIHTVISHRKNIIEKTGIKSLPGLTIFAISKKIIPLNSQ
jgi:DNA-binding CsgD family transcriptional regulator